MFNPILSLLPTVAALSVSVLALAAPSAGAQSAVAGPAQWTISMRAMHNPLPVGQCTVLEIVIQDRASGSPPLRPNGSQLDWQDFELSFYSEAPAAYAWGDERQKLLCARAATPFPARVMARYPARHLRPNERWEGVVAEQFVDVVVQAPQQVGQAPPAVGTPAYPQAPQAAGASAAGAQPSVPYQPQTGYEQVPGVAAGAAGGYGQAGGVPATPGYAPAAAGAAPPYAPGQPQTAPGQPYVPPTAAAPAAGVGAQPPYPQPPQTPAVGPYPGQVATAAGTQGYVPPAATPVSPSPQAAAAATPPPQTAEPPVKDIGGLFKRLGKHMKMKAAEVKDQTVNNLATGATQVVDATAETGNTLVSRTTAGASSAARGAVGGVGQSMMPTALRGGTGSDNLVSAVSAGHAVLRMLRFAGNTDVLEPAGRQLVERLAGSLKVSPDTFVIEAHVDPLLSPAATQELSEHRAAAVKSALVSHGVPGSLLCALGYGASVPMAEIPPEGGPPSSARIELQSFARIRSSVGGRLELCLHQLR